MTVMTGIKLHQEKGLPYLTVFKTSKVLNLLSILLDQNIILGYKAYRDYYTVHTTGNNYKLNKFIFYKIGTPVGKLKKIANLNPQSIFIIKTAKGLSTFEDCLTNNLSGSLYLKIN
jgi:hypothetical protein